MNTERFTVLRKKALESIFTVEALTKTWREIVRAQLRKVDILDLFDYYDFNYNIEKRTRAIRVELLGGSYQTRKPLIYRIEKKYGICRHLVIPDPADALILQTLMEYSARQVLDKQPSKKAMFSRDRDNMKKPHESSEYGLTSREQWQRMQKNIYKFSQDNELIVVTDLSNFYDSISISEVKKVFQSISNVSEVVADLLFNIVAAISWQPDYLPYSGRGLPTCNLEAIRLIAHSFLFEIDEVLVEKTKDCFTRWMDDFVIGCNTRSEAVQIISTLSDMLKSRGLALNIAKTSIYSQEEGLFHFQIEENRLIDSFEKKIADDSFSDADLLFVVDSFNRHYSEEKAKYWEKILKRYITVFGRLKNVFLLDKLVEIYIHQPTVRDNLIVYLKVIGCNRQTQSKVLEILNLIEVYDDVSSFMIAELLVAWEIPYSEDSETFLAEVIQILTSFSFKRALPSDFYALLWLKAKYEAPHTLLTFIAKFENIWQSDTFLRRQVTAILPRCYSIRPEKVSEMLRNQIASGIDNVSSLASQILAFTTTTALDKLLSPYLFPLKVQKPYPLPKFLVLSSVLSSDKMSTNPDVIKLVKKHVTDPYYLRWLNLQYGI